MVPTSSSETVSYILFLSDNLHIHDRESEPHLIQNTHHNGIFTNCGGVKAIALCILRSNLQLITVFSI